ncbi:hypothetical protein FW781_22140 [Chryseobacterium panacisoli]|uniref:Uncharacterized protein n=1 Tax=Chryseobacterium panacisoli TaxID=1807141 RepID=A0A5D8ZBL9_9FLAO|nr:hypothetical protein [Chryseobacterium panacisoli]TZF92221.1 hypothetical protein FW781_22140 [Chryseobacterium panacisoli]
MRTDYILTKVRPIKKMFIVENNDYEAFEKLFLEIQDEIDVIQNLIFVNDDDLWTQTSRDFIKRSDPDIILNLSTLDDNKLSMHFGIFSVKPITDHYKISRFGTNLFSFTKLPTIIKRFNKEEDLEFTVLSGSKLENTPESLLACVNYGLFENKTKEQLPLTIFKNVTANFLTKKEDLINSLFATDNKFIQLTTEIGDFGGSGHGSSIYEVNYNKEGLFQGKQKYIFISKQNDFKTISYFWNTRSYYPYSEIAWIPVDYIEDISAVVDKETTFICFDIELERKIKSLYPNSIISKPSGLHFSGRNERWKFFEHSQMISITDNEAVILHPAEKSFSDIGSIGAFVLETRGLRELVYPKRRSVGKLFFPEYHDFAVFENQFQRISELGLSTYVLKVSPLKAEDISELIRLPSFTKVLKHLFEDIGYTIKTTQKSSILEQTINLLGGLGELSIISDKHIFELLITLTPKVRTEKIVKKLLGGASEKITSDNVLEIIAEIREKGAVNFPSVTLTTEDILAKTTVPRDEKKNLLPILQKLYDQRIFLRGKYFQCPSCSSNLWIQIDQIKRINYCIECSNVVNIPIYLNGKQDSDYFRLNQLIVRAVDQGQLATLLLLNAFYQQKYQTFDYQSNLEVYEGENLITDIDLFIKIGKKIGIAECKSTSGFTETQVNELIKIASKMQCDFIAFSTLIDATREEIRDLVAILNKKSLNIPAFIFTNQSLFNPNSNMIQKNFELRHKEDFLNGPIIVS